MVIVLLVIILLVQVFALAWLYSFQIAIGKELVDLVKASTGPTEKTVRAIRAQLDQMQKSDPVRPVQEIRKPQLVVDYEMSLQEGLEEFEEKA